MQWLWLLVACSCLWAGDAAAFQRDGKGGIIFSQADMDALMANGSPEQVQAAWAEAHQVYEANTLRRHRRWSPTNTYAPGKSQCPPMPNQQDGYVGYLRNASNNEIGPQEADYVHRHRVSTQSAWRTWLKRAGLDGAGGLPGGVDQYLNTLSKQPSVGFAVSGGGYRAMLYGLGIAQGFDGRNETANARGVGGLLQLADYFVGLSGGSWATGAMAINNWPTTQSLLPLMDLQENLISPDHGKISMWTNMFHDLDAKHNAGYTTSLTDYWGRALSMHLLNDSMYANNGRATTFTDIVNVTNFQGAVYPFPITLSIGRQPNELMVNPNASYFEWSPYEFGSWQPSLQAFMPMGYLGTNFNNGQVESSDKMCVSGLENFGFVVGTSSTLFNAAYLKVLQSNSTSVLADMIKSILSDLSLEQNDVAPVNNPFKGYRAGSNAFAGTSELYLVDGGEANQNIPLDPVYQPGRQIDVVIAADGSGDTSSWPNGSSLYETEKRTNLTQFAPAKFPRVPDLNTMVNLGLNTRPSFFGCDASNDTPLLVYLPSYPYSYLANTSTFRMAYNMSEAQQMIDNHVDVATMGGKQADWSTCLACATVKRSLQRSNSAVPSKCQQCYTKYCWNGTFNSTKPGNYTPAVGLPDFITSNGTQLREPAVTGASDEGPSNGDFFSDASSGAASLAVSAPVFTALVMTGVAAVAALY